MPFTLVSTKNCGRWRPCSKTLLQKNELDQQALFIEVKRNIKNYNPELLNSKTAAFTRATGEFKNYIVTQKGVSLEDI